MRRQRRAAALLFFAGIFLLSSGFTGALAVDYGQVLFARSEVRIVADDAAVAAAREYDITETLPAGALLLDQAAADKTAKDIVRLAVAQGSVRRAEIADVDVDVKVVNPSNPLWFEGVTQPTKEAPRVIVTITYTVRGLVLMDLFEAVGNDGTKTVKTGTIVSSAVICVPGLNPDTLDGACARSDS